MYDATTNAGTDGDVYIIGNTLCRPPFSFAKRCTVDIRFKLDGNVKRILEGA